MAEDMRIISIGLPEDKPAVSKYFLCGLEDEIDEAIKNYLRRSGAPEQVIQAIQNASFLSRLMGEDPASYGPAMNSPIPAPTGVLGWSCDILATVAEISQDLQWFWDEEKRLNARNTQLQSERDWANQS